MRLTIALFFATTLVVSAQSIEVPHKLHFADMTLTIRDDARREIQKDVDALTNYAKSFNIKVERARTYFPVIEKIFAEEGVPEDFKFLAIQESALVADAVSVSNAVGYWQFKDYTAMEMGLRVDRDIDERMNIVSATRGAARYIKKNNTFFNNWLFALQAYQMGAGGVLRSEKQSQSGEKNMEITSNTYWYVKKYLAHKIAYEGFTDGSPEVNVVSYETSTDKRTLSDIAREVKIDEEEIKSYNKWLKTQRIPDDRMYAVIIPIKGDPSGIKLPEATATASIATAGLHEKSVKAGTIKTTQGRTKINGIAAIRAAEKETSVILASRASVDLSLFLKWNDISISDRLRPGDFYLLGKKRSRAEVSYHKVVAGESLWTVSQQYGVQLKKLRKYNRLQADSDVKPGMTLWLSGQKPKDSGEIREVEKAIEVSESETFAWEISPAEAQVVVVSSAVGMAEVQATPPKTVQSPLITADGDTTATPSVVIMLEPDSIPSAADSVLTNTNPTNQVEAFAGAAQGTHVVQVKETLYAIARQYNLEVMDLVNWNGLDLQQGIKPGQILRLTPPEISAENTEPAQPVNLIHEVKETDTVYSIARKYGVTIKELMEWNDKRDFNLSVGERLKIIKR